MDRVDVIVPFRNEARLLPRKLRNLARMAGPAGGLRFLLVDGASDDGSRELAEAAVRSDPRFVLVRCPVGDKTKQLNAAWAAGDAPWVLVTDADATLPVDAILRLLAVADGDVAAVGALHRPRRAGRLDRLHWDLWNATRLREWRTGCTSAVLAPCYLLRRDGFPGWPAGVVADDLYAAFHALARGRRVALAEVLAVERRAPAGALAFAFHKVRKGRAVVREVLRFLPAAGRMPARQRRVFLVRAGSVLVAPWLVLAAAGVLTPLLLVRRWRGRVGLVLILAVVLAVAQVTAPFVRQRARFSRWRQEES